MEIVLNSNFSEISYNEMELIEGGGWREFGYAMGKLSPLSRTF